MCQCTFYPLYYIFNEAIKNIDSDNKRKKINKYKHKDQHSRRESFKTQMFTQIKIVPLIIKYYLIYFVNIKSTYYNLYPTVF